MNLKCKVCKTEKGYLTHHYFLIEGDLKNFFSQDVDNAWNFFENDGLDIDVLCDKTGVKSVEFIEM